MSNVKSLYPDFCTIDEAISLDNDTTRKLQLEHLNKRRTLDGHSKYFVRAEGATLIDEKGNKHLDMIGAVGVCTVGNNNDFVWQGIKKCYEKKLFMMGAIGYHNVAAALAHNLALLSPGKKLTRVWTATGGAEAIEGMIKLVKIATRNQPEKTHILSTINSFHGKTTGAVSLGGKDTWKLYQEPTLPGINHIPYGDIDEVEKELAKGIYKAFVIEPIQGEGGIIVPPKGYLSKVREICNKYNTFLVFDEIQCGVARTGKFWCCEHENVIPDCIVFAKGLSGGLIPFGGFNCTDELYELAYGSSETCWHHTATYQENTLSAAAALGALQYILENDLCKEATEKGAYLFNKLKEIQAKYPHIIKEVRGKGLMIGVEFYPIDEKLKGKFGDYYTGLVHAEMVDVHLVQVLYTINNMSVIRFLPPLVISKEELDYGSNAFLKSIETVDKKVNQN